MKRLIIILGMLLCGATASPAATKVYMKQQFNSVSGLSAYYYASLAESVLASASCVTTKINGTTQETITAGGAVCEWISPPLAQAVTLSSAETCNLWVKTSSTSGAPKSICRIYKYSGGTSTQIGTATSTHTQTTSIANDSFTVTPTSTAFAIGDRIGEAVFVSSTSATGTETLDHAGKTSGSDGDSYVSYAETLSFQNEPEFIQLGSGGQFSGTFQTFTAVMPGTTVAGNLLVPVGTVVGADGLSVADTGSDSFVSLSVNPMLWNGSAQNDFVWWKGGVVGGGVQTFTFTKSASDTQIAVGQIFEYGGMAASPFDVTASAFNSGTGTAMSSNATPTVNYRNELIVGFEDDGGTTFTAGSGYVSRVPGSEGLILEDQSIYNSAYTTYTATGTLSPSDAWVMTVLTFQWGTQPPSGMPPVIFGEFFSRAKL